MNLKRSFTPTPCLKPGEKLLEEYNDQKWKRAMDDEIENMSQLGTFKWVDEKGKENLEGFLMSRKMMTLNQNIEQD